jgi:hypothetical protein
MKRTSRITEYSPLPKSAQEIAEVIGREKALFLIGTHRSVGRRSWRVNIYVPKRLPPDHNLVRLLGWQSAKKLSDYFGGEILQPSNCRCIEREFRNQAIMERHEAGMPAREIADSLGVTYDTVKKLIWARGNSPVAMTADNDNDPGTHLCRSRNDKAEL